MSEHWNKMIEMRSLETNNTRKIESKRGQEDTGSCDLVLISIKYFGNNNYGNKFSIEIRSKIY